MQLTIDIDPSKINYEKITDQLAEKLKDADVEEIITSNCLIEKIIRDIVYQRVYNKFEDYLLSELRWIDANGRLTDKFKADFKEYMNNVYKEGIHKLINTEIEKIDVESVDETIVKISPNILVAVLIEFYRNNLVTTTEVMRADAIRDSGKMIRYAFHASGIQTAEIPNPDVLPDY